MAGLGLLVAAAGAVGVILRMSNIVPAFSRLPIPQVVWPAMLVVGVIVYILMRRAAD
ncbi:MAG TPA: hypothetical protein PLO37_01260 [Candidatus Hydrogenedentes bacterium]|nr:hypothetical protein [Candidatus Hydrogenedentota bacterium]HPG65444.1 hypothetical protein [Candidatus Hydrogenedentota bacterium]